MAEQETIKKLKRQNEELDRQIADKKNLLSEKAGSKKKYEDAYNEASKAVTPELLKKVNAYLEKQSNEAGCYSLEALIGLLRGTKKADNFSVELYLKKHEGFMMGIERVEPKKLNAEYCQYHLDQLRSKYDREFQSESLALFRPFKNLLEKLCELGIFCKDEGGMEDFIEQRTSEYQKNQREIEAKEALLANLDVIEAIKEDCSYYKNTQLAFFQDKLKRVNKELQEVEKSLENFENNYFSDI